MATEDTRKSGVRGAVVRRAVTGSSGYSFMRGDLECWLGWSARRVIAANRRAGGLFSPILGNFHYDTGRQDPLSFRLCSECQTEIEDFVIRNIGNVRSDYIGPGSQVPYYVERRERH